MTYNSQCHSVVDFKGKFKTGHCVSPEDKQVDRIRHLQ